MLTPRCCGPSGSVALLFTCLLTTAGCYDVDGEPAGPPGTGPADSAIGTDTGTASDSATGADSGASDSGPGPADTGAGDGGPTDSGASDSGTVDTGPGASCPDVYGAFSLTPAVMGCGDLSTSAPQRIDGDRMACLATFSSTGGIDGTATVSADGSFSGASLSLGSTAYTNCTGMWMAAISTMTVVCGSGPSRCSVTLSRTGP